MFDNSPFASVCLHDILGALGHALDLTEGQPIGHCQRCAWIGVHVGREIGMGEVELAELYYTVLLKDLGCSSNAARICELYLADDLSFKREFKLIDGSLGAALRFVVAQTARGSGVAERFRSVVHILQNGGEIARSLIETRCHRGADIAARLRFPAAVQDGVRSLDERWDGSGKSDGLRGAAIPLYSRIALLAQVADVFHAEQGADQVAARIRSRSGTWFDPGLVRAFVRVQGQPGFWEPLTAENADPAILGAVAPVRARLPVDADYLDDIAAAFADVIDAKSPFTAGHSQRVMLFSDMIAEQLGVSDGHRRWLRRAALLHDIGKLGVSNTILDKPGKPDDVEWAAIRRHPALGRTLLSHVPVLADTAFVAGTHHERLDGRGYPDGATAADLGLDSRIASVADVFDALSAERPYRGAMPIPTGVRHHGGGYRDCLRRGLHRGAAGRTRGGGDGLAPLGPAVPAWRRDLPSRERTRRSYRDVWRWRGRGACGRSDRGRACVYVRPAGAGSNARIPDQPPAAGAPVRSRAGRATGAS